MKNLTPDPFPKKEGEEPELGSDGVPFLHREGGRGVRSTIADDAIIDRPALKRRAGESNSVVSHLAVEEPLEIRLGGRRFTLTMRVVS